MLFRSGDRVFVDESKAREYLIVATAVSPANVGESERALKALLLPAQRRIHFTSERDSRRREVLSRIAELDVRVAIWHTRERSDGVARSRCLGALTTALVAGGAKRLIIERDASVEKRDRREIAQVLRRSNAAELHYEHAQPSAFPLLWVSDAVGWCYSKRGAWRAQIAPLVLDRVYQV